MRYSVMNVTLGQLQAVGATKVKTPQNIPVKFCELTKEQAAKLREQGFEVLSTSKVKADIFIPPEPPVEEEIPPEFEFTPEELLILVGADELPEVPLPPGPTPTPGITPEPTTEPIIPPSPPLYGSGVGIAIIDSGIRETHVLILDRVVYSKNYTTDTMADVFNHGTGIASLAVAAAPASNLLNLKVLGSNGVGEEEDVVMAIDDCIQLFITRSQFAPRVINLSLGSPDDGNRNNVLRVACREAASRGIWVLAAAGNGGPSPNTITAPATEKYVFAVGSAKYLRAQESFEVSSFSSRGPTVEGLAKPDMIMFSENVKVASSEDDTAVVVRTGTSYGTPVSAGLATLYLEGSLRIAGYAPGQDDLPEASYTVPPLPDQVIDEFLPRVCVKPAGTVTAKDNVYGNGLLYGPAVIGLLQPSAPAGLDISNILTPVITVMVVGMMMKVMR